MNADTPAPARNLATRASDSTSIAAAVAAAPARNLATASSNESLAWIVSIIVVVIGIVAALDGSSCARKHGRLSVHYDGGKRGDIALRL